jgi:hypothetical protein
MPRGVIAPVSAHARTINSPPTFLTPQKVDPQQNLLGIKNVGKVGLGIKNLGYGLGADDSL